MTSLPGDAVMMIGTAGKGNAATGIDPAQHRRLVDAAEQFEAMFLQQLMKSSGEDGGEAGAGAGWGAEAGDDSGVGSAGGSGRSYSDFAAEFVSKAVARAGGVGIARSVIAGVERAAAHTRPAPDTDTEKSPARLKSS